MEVQQGSVTSPWLLKVFMDELYEIKVRLGDNSKLLNFGGTESKLPQLLNGDAFLLAEKRFRQKCRLL